MSSGLVTTGRRLLSGLPSGTLAVGGGLAVLGVSAYVFLAFAARSLGPVAFAPVSVLWVVVSAVGPGLMLPLELEVSRAVAHRSVRGIGGRPVLIKAGALGLGLLLAVVLLVVALLPVVRDRLFSGDTALVVCLVAALAATWGSYLSRGVFSGTGRFTRYGTQLAVDGLVRGLGATALLALAVPSAVPFGVLVALAPAVAVVATASRPHRLLDEGPPAPWREVSQALGLLLCAALGSQLLVNAGPVAVQLLAPDDTSGTAGVFLAGLVLARVPLFAFAAVQAAMLPGLTRFAAVGDRTGYTGLLRRIALGVAGLGALGTLVCGAAGPELMHLLYGPGYELSRWVLVGLAVATTLYMVTTVLSQALVSLRAYRTTAALWATSFAVFLVALVPGGSLAGRVTTAFLVACAASTGLGVLGLFLRMRSSIDPGDPTPPPAAAT